MENGDSKIHHGLCLIRALSPHRCNQFVGSKCPCKPGDHEQKNSPVEAYVKLYMRDWQPLWNEGKQTVFILWFSLSNTYISENDT